MRGISIGLIIGKDRSWRGEQASFCEGSTSVFRIKKSVLQLALLVVGVAMLSFGALRGEADTVLAKAVRLCLECVGIG